MATKNSVSVCQTSEPLSAKELTHHIIERLGAATEAARAAEARATAGNTDQALLLLRDVEQQIYEVTTLLNAASLLSRTS